MDKLSAQVTPDPKIDRKSAPNVFINKIEITEEFTVFHMQFYDKSEQRGFDQYLKENPDLGRRLKEMGVTPDQAMKMLRGTTGGQTISFQPGSKILLADGRRFGFVKAVNIPVSPERQEVENGKKYFFKVYFEKIPAGFESIDMIENEQDSEDGFQFWNFKGIHIVNPKNRKPAEESQLEEEKFEARDFRLYGKILDAETQKPINAKIVCVETATGEVIDSLQTSRTGKYEFLLNNEEVTYKVSAEGFSDLSEAINLRFFLKSGYFEKDIYLDANSKDTVKEEENMELRAEEENSIGEPLDEESSSFKLDKVYFNLGQAVVLEDSYHQLDNLANYLKVNTDLKIQIEGHTDNQGDAKANQKLSLDRAFNVRQYLISKGIDGKRIKFKGYGSSKPVSQNDTEESRSRNRRVEYKFID